MHRSRLAPRDGWPAFPLVKYGLVGLPGLEPGTSSLSGFCSRACFRRIAPATCANDLPLETAGDRCEPLGSDGMWTKRGPSHDHQPAGPMADASAHGPLDPSSGGREAALAARWRRLRDGVPSALYLLGWALVLLVALVALGWLLSKVVHDDGLGRADAGLSRWLAGERTADLNTLTRWTTWLSETITVTVLAVVTVAITALVWRQWREPMLVAVAVAGEVAIFLAITLLVDRRRPPVSHLDQAPPTSSFPSGHTAAAICLYGALAVLASQRARSALVRGLTLTLAVLIPLAVAAARVYRGTHYLTDVVGGILLGGAWLLATVLGIRLGWPTGSCDTGRPAASDGLRRPSISVCRPRPAMTPAKSAGIGRLGGHVRRWRCPATHHGGASYAA